MQCHCIQCEVRLPTRMLDPLIRTLFLCVRTDGWQQDSPMQPAGILKAVTGPADGMEGVLSWAMNDDMMAPECARRR